jgi:hypothetical protein
VTRRYQRRQAAVLLGYDSERIAVCLSSFQPDCFVLQGGFKLQVLDTLQRPVLDLTPVTADSEFVKNDVT